MEAFCSTCARAGRSTSDPDPARPGASRLASRAPECASPRLHDPHDRRAAPRTGLALAVVDAQPVLELAPAAIHRPVVAQAGAFSAQGFAKHGAQRPVEAAVIVGAEVPAGE